MAINGYTSLYIAIYGYRWQNMAIADNTWLHTATDTWLYMNMHVYTW